MDALVDTFTDTFYALVKQIPEGKVSTYGALARALGDVRASRAVGRMLNMNPRPVIVPCHRVVMSDGAIGGFGLGVEKKISFLEEEGVFVEGDKVVDFEEKYFDDFTSDLPLNSLREEQDRLVAQVLIEDKHDDLETIMGVDVSYGDELAYGAFTLWQDNEKIDEKTISYKVSFPYIPTYLAYRELPPLLKLIKQIERPDVIMVDGNGYLHPRHLGIASHLGAVTDIPTLGVAKSLLLGEVEGTVSDSDPVSPIRYRGETVGYAFLSSSRAKNPVYVSAGHRLSHGTALKLVKRYCKYKIPEPIRHAHELANKARKGDVS
ncbi:MAG: endonuclease V [Thermoplasmata archaeon]